MQQSNHRANAEGWLAHGAIGGVVAGIFMAMTSMVWMWASQEGFFKPLNLIASIVMGEDAIAPGFQMTEAIVGMMLHLIMSTVFGVIFAWIIANTAWSSSTIVAIGIAYGLLLWIVNVVIINALFIPGGLSEAPVMLNIIVHTVYGLALGVSLAPRLTHVR